VVGKGWLDGVVEDLKRDTCRSVLV